MDTKEQRKSDAVLSVFCRLPSLINHSSTLQILGCSIPPSVSDQSIHRLLLDDIRMKKLAVRLFDQIIDEILNENLKDQW